MDWLPENKSAALCFTIDDIHPAKSTDAYEAGGDLEQGALGHVIWLLKRQTKLQVTLFTTPDWRQISPTPTRPLLANLPGLNEHIYLAEVLPAGTMNVAHHPDFVEFLNAMPRTEVAFHGLHHLHKGPRIPVEFQSQDRETCGSMLQQALDIFQEAGLRFSPGLQPPGWNLTDALTEAASDVGLTWAASARDIRTSISPNAQTSMSGLTGVSLIYPEVINSRGLVHFSSNFQATSPIERAFEIIENGGCLNIKAHIVKNAMGHVALDGVDRLYMNYLDVLCSELNRRYGDSIWWTTMGQIAERIHGQHDD